MIFRKCGSTCFTTYPIVPTDACTREAIDVVCARAAVLTGIRGTLVNVCRIYEINSTATNYNKHSTVIDHYNIVSSYKLLFLSNGVDYSVIYYNQHNTVHTQFY